jgi:hypothetical protein
VAAPAPTLVNPYACFDPNLDRPGAAAIRAATLLAYLEARSQPVLLLVGEAAGYQGCRFSGIAFTSERSLPPSQWTSSRPEGGKEPSATIVHGALKALELEERTILWNVVPFHPAGPSSLSNRRPTAAERQCWDGVAAAPPRDHGAGHGGGHRSGCRGGTASWDAVSPSPSARRGW